MTDRFNTTDRLELGELRPAVPTPPPVPRQGLNLRSLLVQFRDLPLEERLQTILRISGAESPEHIGIVRERVQAILDSFDIKRLDLDSPDALEEIGSVVGVLDWSNKTSDERTVATVLELYKVDSNDGAAVESVRRIVKKALDRMPQGGA